MKFYLMISIQFKHSRHFKKFASKDFKHGFNYLFTFTLGAVENKTKKYETKLMKIPKNF